MASVLSPLSPGASDEEYQASPTSVLETSSSPTGKGAALGRSKTHIYSRRTRKPAAWSGPLDSKTKPCEGFSPTGLQERSLAKSWDSTQLSGIGKVFTSEGNETKDTYNNPLYDFALPRAESFMAFAHLFRTKHERKPETEETGLLSPSGVKVQEKGMVSEISIVPGSPESDTDLFELDPSKVMSPPAAKRKGTASVSLPPRSLFRLKMPGHEAIEDFLTAFPDDPLSPRGTPTEGEEPIGEDQESLEEAKRTLEALAKAAASPLRSLPLRSKGPALTPIKIPHHPIDIDGPPFWSSGGLSPITPRKSANPTPRGLSYDGKQRTAEELIADYMALENRNTLQRVKAKARAALAAKDGEIRALRARVADLETSPAKPELTPTKPDGSDSASEGAQLCDVPGESRARAEAAERDVRALEDGLLLAGGRIAELQERLEATQEDATVVATRLSAKLRQKEEELQAVDSKRSELERELADLKTRTQGEREAAAEREARLTEESAALREAAARAQRERDEMAAELEALAAIADVLQRALATTGARARDLEMELEAARGEAARRLMEVAALQRQLEGREKESAAVRNGAEEETDVAVELQGKSEEIEPALEKESEVQRLARELEASQNTVARLQRELGATRAAEETARAVALTKDEETVKVVNEKDDETVSLLTELEVSHGVIVEMGHELRRSDERCASSVRELTSQLAAASARLARVEEELAAARLDAGALATEKEKEIKRLSEELVESLEALQRVAEEREALAREREALRAAAAGAAGAHRPEAGEFAREVVATQTALEKARAYVLARSASL